VKKNEMIVIIKQGTELKSPDGSKRFTSFLSLELNLPSLEKQTKASSTFEHAENANYNFTCSFNLPPSNKIGRGFKLARLEVKVLCPRLFSTAVLGESTFKLGDLFEKCELTSIVSLKKEGKSVGKLDIAIRIRQPFKGKDIRSCKAEVLVIDHFFDNPAAIPFLDSSVESKMESLHQKRRSKDSAERKPSDVIKNSDSSIVKPQSNSESKLQAQDNLNDIKTEDFKDPHNLDLLISCDVLRMELENLMTMIATSKAKKLPVENSLENRYIFVQAKVKSLEEQVQDGTLTLNLYVEMLQNSVAYHLKLIKALKAAERIEDAKKVLARLKTMQLEIKSAKEISQE
jgi:hypothetical protein